MTCPGCSDCAMGNVCVVPSDTPDPAADRAVSAALDLHELLSCLQRVLSTLDRTAAGPDEQRVYDEARALLARHGLVGGEEYRRQFEEWQERRNA